MNRPILLAALLLSGNAYAQSGSPDGLIAYSAWDDDLNYDVFIVAPGVPDATPVRLTTDGRYNSNPDFSSDGRKIVFDGWGQEGGPRIQVMDVDPGTDDATVISDPCADSLDCYGDFQPVWSPSSTRIAFVSSRPNADGSPNWSYEIYVMDAAGELPPAARATRLTTDPLPEFGTGINDSQVTWSPDGSRIAFLSQGRGAEEDSCDLWMMDSHDTDEDGVGDHLTRLTFDEGFNCDSFEDVSPMWSPTANFVAFTSVRSGYFDIWVVNTDDPTDLRNVTQTLDQYEDQPTWSPDGANVVFRSDKSGAYEFYSLPMPADAVAAQALPAPPPVATRLTFDGMQKQQPAWGEVASTAPSTQRLTIVPSAGGTVIVPGRDIGKLNCGTDCVGTYLASSQKRLKARPASGYRFVGWRGVAGCAKVTCTITMRYSRSVQALFAPVPK